MWALNITRGAKFLLIHVREQSDARGVFTTSKYINKYINKLRPAKALKSSSRSPLLMVCAQKQCMLTSPCLMKLLILLLHLTTQILKWLRKCPCRPC